MLISEWSYDADLVKPIIIMTDEFFPTKAGIAVFVDGLAKALHEEGFALKLWCPKHWNLKELKFSYPVERVAVDSGQKLRHRKQWGRFLKRNLDRWTGHRLLLASPTPIYTFMEATRWGLPIPEEFDLIFHGNEISRLTKTSSDRDLLYQLLIRAQSVGVVSSFGQKRLLECFPDLKEEIRVIHPGFRSDLKIKDQLKSARDTFRILTVARVVPVKGHLSMIKALGKLNRSIRQQIEYRLVGPVSFFPFLWFLKFMALWLGVRMIWRGSLDSEGLAQEYQNADLFALTSVPFMGRSEAFGFVYLEAGLFRLPLLGHKIGGVEDIIVDGQTGFLCEVNQTKELSDRILLLIKDADLRKRMGDLAHERSKQFTWKRFVSEFYPRDADLLFQMPKVSRE